MVTINDVAKAAGVSPMTVSHVINDHANVRATTRAKVMEAIAELDYRVNHAARNLKMGRTGTIGLAVPEVDRPYFAQLAASVLAAARSHGLRVAIEQTGGTREGELDALGLTRNRLYDGLIMSAVGLGAEDAELLKVDFPMVLLGERIFAGPVDHLAMANVDASKAAALHLASKGCRRIAMVGALFGSDTEMGTLRTEGWRQGVEESGAEFDRELAITLAVNTMQEGLEAAHRMVEAGLAFDGAFCVTDTVALGFLRGLADRGVRVPGDVRVIGFDDIAESAFTVPTLSSIDPDTAEMAQRAVGLLVDRIAGRADDTRPPVEYVSSFSVVERESSR